MLNMKRSYSFISYGSAETITGISCMKYSCFVYQPGIHFTIPSEYQHIKQLLCYFAHIDENSHIAPHKSIFVETENTDTADFFLFPFDMKNFSDISLQSAYRDIIRSLPFYQGNEKRHIIFDTGDSCTVIDTPCCLFKVSLSEEDKGRAVVLPYTVPDFILQEKPEFNFSHIKYDISFVGNVTHPFRKLACSSIQLNKQVKSKIDIDSSVKIVRDQNSIVVHHEEHDEKYQQIRQMKYLYASKNSRMVLCPPGVGPQSIRMYETMYLGRIPILFDVNVLYPFQDEIDYETFTYTISKDDSKNIGDAIFSYIHSHTVQELDEKCIYAHKIWRTWFSDAVLPQKLMERASILNR